MAFCSHEPVLCQCDDSSEERERRDVSDMEAALCITSPHCARNLNLAAPTGPLMSTEPF